MRLIAPLPEGPIDVVGDVHGELEALEQLLRKLGYDAAGVHAGGRRLVFVGDLVDRGPDSPGVVERVSRLVDEGRAQCVLGNHELNLLRGAIKRGNEWYTQPDAAPALHVQPIASGQKPRFHAFFASLPLALERADVRVVHACWQHDAVRQVRAAQRAGTTAIDLFRHHERETDARIAAEQATAEYRAEEARWGEKLSGADCAGVPLLPAHARAQLLEQMGNPVKVLTSGEERPARAPFVAGGKCRLVERVKWWDAYADDVPVVVGHYWRRYHGAHRYITEERGPDLFAGIEPHHWMGASNRVYCVDFSVGARAGARRRAQPTFAFRLAAVRVPEWTVMDDHGSEWKIEPAQRPAGGAPPGG